MYKDSDRIHTKKTNNPNMIHGKLFNFTVSIDMFESEMSHELECTIE